jgi:glyoxylase-like metal-dependent hydrolase (beta-lactamase superfamily II)
MPRVIASVANFRPNSGLLPNRPHPVRLLPGLYQVGGGFLSHARDACSYLIVDETTGDAIMVDCGSHSGFEALKANLKQVTGLNQVKLVIGTHCHWDHVEAFGHLFSETGATFATHALDAEAVRTGDPELTCAGFLYNEPFHTFPIDLLLQGGEQFEVGDYRLEILHLPGHTPGCIGVKLVNSRSGQAILIPGDSVQGGFSKRVRSSVMAWKRSMRRLMQDRFDYMLPNHLPNGAQTALLADVPNRLARCYGQLQTDFHAFMDNQWV